MLQSSMKHKPAIYTRLMNVEEARSRPVVRFTLKSAVGLHMAKSIPVDPHQVALLARPVFGADGRTILGAVESSNPVGRTITDLEVLLGPLMRRDATHAEDQERSWPIGQTIAFIVVSCGLFWTAAIIAAWSWL